MSYQGEERRVEDRLLIRIFDSVSELRGELKAHNEKVDALEKKLDHIGRVIERWKTVIWVLASIGTALAWIESQWKILSKAFRAIIGP